MARNTESPTLADFILPAISPALIIGLVASLVIFLSEVLYGGKYEGRVNHTLFFFSAGIVLVARISIVVDPQRAYAYGFFLGGATWIALKAYVEYPADSWISSLSWLINIFLILIVSWSAYKLTWDCTFIDDKRPSSSQGLLSVLGIDNSATTRNQFDRVLPETKAPKSKKKRTWIERWRDVQAAREKKPHSPGLTVIYFSIAALPIFGLGQSLIPADDSPRRNMTFWLAAIYISCALGLLITTSFLGLRRYLRQRKLQMPKVMAAVWLGMGGVLILGFVFISAFLPRPFAETSVFSMNRAGSGDRNASKNAVMKSDSGKGDGKAGDQTQAGDGDATGKKGDPGGKGQGNRKDGSPSGDKSKDGKSSSGEKGEKGDQSKGDSSQKGSEENKDKSNESQNKNGENSKDTSDKNGNTKSQSQSKGKPGDAKSQGTSDSDSYRKFQSGALGKAVEMIAKFLKWLVFIVIVIIVLAVLFRGVLQNLSEIFPWAKRWLDAINAWWNRLFARKAKEVSSNEKRDEKPKHMPFRSFSNPFSDGSAAGRPIEELIGYSFQALEAWAADREQPSKPEETPLEFASRMTKSFPDFERDAHKLASLVARMAYSEGTIPRTAASTLEAFWDRIIDIPTKAPELDYEVVETL